MNRKDIRKAMIEKELTYDGLTALVNSQIKAKYATDTIKKVVYEKRNNEEISNAIHNVLIGE